MKIKCFPELHSQSGGVLLEYGISIKCIVIATLLAVSFLGASSQAYFSRAGEAISGRSTRLHLSGGYTGAGGLGTKKDGGTVGGTNLYTEGSHSGANNGMSGGL